jgi:hypothetical protein
VLLLFVATALTQLDASAIIPLYADLDFLALLSQHI